MYSFLPSLSVWWRGGGGGRRRCRGGRAPGGVAPNWARSPLAKSTRHRSPEDSADSVDQALLTIRDEGDWLSPNDSTEMGAEPLPVILVLNLNHSKGHWEQLTASVECNSGKQLACGEGTRLSAWFRALYDQAPTHPKLCQNSAINDQTCLCNTT